MHKRSQLKLLALITLTVLIFPIISSPIVKAVALAPGVIRLFASEHRKNKRKSTHDKHTKPRAGRGNEKKKQTRHWKKRR